MTGRGTPRRHIESSRVTGYRLNANESAIAFRDRVLFASTFNTLHPTLLVKSLGPNLKDSGSGRERNDSDNQDNELLFPHIDSRSKPKPGQVPKLHFSFDELASNPNGPHIKWVDPFVPPSPADSARMLRAAFAWKAQNPDPIIVDRRRSEPGTYGNQRQKGLGPTLRDLNPRGTIDLAGAIARGVIVDADGKMRCPPGTPNANQFTDEFMTNCSTPSAGRVARFARNVFARLHETEMRGRNIRLARTAGQRLGEATQNLASAEEIADATAARSQRIKDALNELGVSLSSDFNGDYIEALSALAERGDGPEFKSLFTGGVVGLDGQPFIWDDAKSTLENIREYDRLVGESYEELIINQLWQSASAQALSSSQTPPAYDDFKNGLTAKSRDDIKKIAAPLAERHQQAMRGFMASLIDIYTTDPDQLRALKQVTAFVPGDDDSIDQWWATEGITFPTSVVVDGKQQLGASIGFNPYKLAMEPFIDSVGLEGGAQFRLNPAIADLSEAERAQKVEQAISEIADAMEFSQAIDFANVVSASRVKRGDPGLAFTELRAMHVGYHEFAHVLQYAQAQKFIFDALDTDGELKLYSFDSNGMPKVRRVIKKPADGQTLALNDIVDAITSLMTKYNGPDHTFPPVNAGVLESSMTHLLAGKYYKNEIQEALSVDPTIASDERIHKVKMAVNEATAEIFALQRMGVVRGEDIERVTGWLNETLSPKTIQPITNETPGQPHPPRQLDSDYISPVRVPSVLAQYRSKPAIQQAADVGRFETVKEDASIVVDRLVSSGPRRPSNPYAPKNGDVTSGWSGISRLIFTDSDTGIGDTSPSSRPSQRRSAVGQWADGFFELPESAGSGLQYSEMTPEMLDQRFEIIQDEASTLLARESLNPDEQARLWAAVEDMGNVVSENNFRRLLADDDRSRASLSGRQTVPGINASLVGSEETPELLQESLRNAGRDDATSSPVDTDEFVYVKLGIGYHFNEFAESAERGAPDYRPDPDASRQFADRIQRQRTDRLKNQFSSQTQILGSNGVADIVSGRGIPPSDRTPASLLRSNGDPLEAIELFNDAVSRNDSTAVDDPTPDAISRSLAKELSEVILPAIDLLNKSTFEEDIELFAVLDTDSELPLIEGEPVRHGIVSASIAPREATQGDVGVQASTQKLVRIVIRRGDNGTLTADAEGNVNGGMIPPGTIRITDVGPDGIPVSVISDQKTSTRVAKNLLSRLNSREVNDELAESVDQVKSALGGYIEKQRINPARFQGRTRRGYDASQGRDRQGRGKAASVSEALVDSGSTPFRSSSATERRQSVAGQMRSISQLSKRLSSPDADPADDREYELQQRIKKMPNLNIEVELLDALTAFASSMSDRPRLAISRNELNDLALSRADDGIYASNELGNGSINPFFNMRLASDQNIGFSPDAAPALRPISASIVHGGDVARGEKYISSFADKKLLRNVDFVSESPNFSVHSGLSAETPIDVIMSPTVSERTAFSSTPLDSVGAYAGLASNSPDELTAAILPFGNNGLDDRDALAMALDIIEAKRNGNVDISPLISTDGNSTTMHAAIVGGISSDDIDAIRIPIQSLEQPANSLEFSDLGFSSKVEATSALVQIGLSSEDAESVLDYVMSPSSDLDSTQQMRLSRLARSQAARFGDLSDKLIFTNKYGIDLTDVSTFAGLPYFKDGDDLDVILTKRNHIELLESARTIADDLRSGKKRISKVAAMPIPTKEVSVGRRSASSTRGATY